MPKKYLLTTTATRKAKEQPSGMPKKHLLNITAFRNAKETPQYNSLQECQRNTSLI
jgi:hypothetical protein